MLFYKIKKQGEKCMTIKDVALRAGVSISTVSKVINNNGSSVASIDVENKIWNAVVEIGYTPNHIAKSLRTQKNDENKKGNIYIYFARRENGVINEFFDELAQAVMRECLKEGYSIGGKFIKRTFDEFLNKSPVITKNDGLMILGRPLTIPQKFIDIFHDRIVYVGLNKSPLACNQVICDGYNATMTAMNYLYDQGHRNIAYVGRIHDEVRFLAYKNFLKQKRLSACDRYVFQTVMNTAGGNAAAKEFISSNNGCTAIFCANDETAIGLVEDFVARNLKIGSDISVISIDNIRKLGVIDVPLTTISVPIVDLGEMGVRILVDQIVNRRSVVINVELNYELLVRSSVARI